METSITFPNWINEFRKNSARMMYLSGMTSLPWIITMTLFYFKASGYLGYNPGYDHPDPKELSFYTEYERIIDLTGQIWFCSLVAWVVVFFLTIIISRKRIGWKPIVISGICHFLGILFFMSEIAEWYFD